MAFPRPSPAVALPAPSWPPRGAPHTPVSSAAPSGAGPGPAQRPPRPQADSRTACGQGPVVSRGGQGGGWVKTRWQVGRTGANGDGCPAGTRGTRQGARVPCRLLRVGAGGSQAVAKLVTPQEPRQRRAGSPGSSGRSVCGNSVVTLAPCGCHHHDFCPIHAPLPSLSVSYFSCNRLSLPSCFLTLRN